MGSAPSAIRLACRFFITVALTALLSGCGIIDAIRDRPLISEMGILQSRKEHERRLQQYNAELESQSPSSSRVSPTGATPAADISR
jgi:hypothetical protein